MESEPNHVLDLCKQLTLLETLIDSFDDRIKKNSRCIYISREDIEYLKMILGNINVIMGLIDKFRSVAIQRVAYAKGAMDHVCTLLQRCYNDYAASNRDDAVDAISSGMRNINLELKF